MNCIDEIKDNEIISEKKPLKGLCLHGKNGSCNNCVNLEGPTDEKERKKFLENQIQNTLIKKCNHGPRTKCLNCLFGNVNEAKYDSFDSFLKKAKKECLNHSKETRCIHCTFNFEVSYKKKLNCKNHPANGSCNAC